MQTIVGILTLISMINTTSERLKAKKTSLFIVIFHRASKVKKKKKKKKKKTRKIAIIFLHIN